MGIEFKSKMSNEGKAFEDAVKKIVNTSAKVGWFGMYPADKNGVSKSVGGVAYNNEMGVGRIPPRPFLRPSIDSNKNKWMGALRSQIKQVFNGDKSIDQALMTTGLLAQKDIQNTIADLWSPALSPATINIRERKRGVDSGSGSSSKNLSRKQIKKEAFSSNRTPGSLIDKPLIDTGIFINSITTVIEK